MRIEAAARAPGVQPDRAIAWWSDFRDGPTDHAFIPGQRRRIVARDEAGTTMEERWLGIPMETTTAQVEASQVRFSGRNLFADFAGRYVFESDPAGGTRIRCDVELGLRGPLRWTKAVAAPVAKALIAWDLRAHAKELAREGGAAAVSSGSAVSR